MDAGKTTLAEGILFCCGQIRNPGRVDHGDAFLDHFSLERSRGITIFSKQAQIAWKGRGITLLDTPGHVDFGAEMERNLQVMDAAVLVVSAPEGVQGHTETLWGLLKRYGIPVFVWVNKMDREGLDREKILSEIRGKLDGNCVDFTGLPDADIVENIASCEEMLMEEFIESGELREESIAAAVAERSVFPCFFGSALKLCGIEELLDGIVRYLPFYEYGDEFGARVYKITRDADGNRITHLKITGGELKSKQLLSNRREENAGSKDEAGLSVKDQIWEEKADQLRIYNGEKYQVTDTAGAGQICAVTGLKNTFAGQGLGAEKEDLRPILEPVMVYHVELLQGTDPVAAAAKLKLLMEEIPEIAVSFQRESGQILVHVMGEIQTQILKSLVSDRFGMEISFGEGNIVYRETIAAPVEGIGHFEPLRHYAEVHLLMEPGERGSGLSFASALTEDELDGNWQRLILTHLAEKEHAGVLTGSAITDIRILLIAGRAHEKHTEGGDFRQATYRAVRQGLMKAENLLLEPVFSFRLAVPTECIGRAMTDMKRMYARFSEPEVSGELSILSGTVPAAAVQGYQTQVSAYTRGRGSLHLAMNGYEPCHNTEEVLEKYKYDPEADTGNPADSVFCSHGAGCVINWRDVDSYAHVESRWNPERLSGIYIDQEDLQTQTFSPGGRNPANEAAGYITQEEIEEIFARTYKKKQNPGGAKYKKFHDPGGYDRNRSSRALRREFGGEAKEYKYEPIPKKKEYLLVDGYNIIFSWEELSDLAKVNLDSARDRLADIMSNYRGCIGSELILVFDAYKVKNNPGSVERRGNIYIVYTKEAQTADQYIEEAVHEMGKKYDVAVATSDGLEQMIIFGEGAKRISARGLKEAVEFEERRLREDYLTKEESLGNRMTKTDFSDKIDGVRSFWDSDKK